MTKDFKIPATIAAAQKALDGLGQLLTAKEWERAAIVFAFTTDGERGGDQSIRNTENALTPNAFSKLEITGLRSDNTVRMYRKCWQIAIDDGQAQPVKPGETITLPTRDFPPTKTGTLESNVDNVMAAIERNPVGVAEALRDKGGAVADALVEVDPGGRFERTVTSARYKQPDERTAYPRPRVERDYSEDLRASVGRLVPIVHAVRDGKWEPDALEKALLHFASKALAEIGGGTRVPDELFDEIRGHLEAART